MSDQIPTARLTLALLAVGSDGPTHWLETLLQSGGYAVLRERTGQHALKRARAAQPDLIIVDAELPDMAGVELCRALRQDSRITNSTPIFVVIPEHPTREGRLAALRAGAWECIAPPHDADEILLRVGVYVRAKLDGDRARAEGLLDPETGLYNRQGLARRAREVGSQAFREHGALACVALALDLEGGDAVAADDETTAAAVVHCAHVLKSKARLSDVIGRLSATEFAVLAPGTDAAGARRLAERLAGIIEASAGSPEPTAPVLPALRARFGYEAVANVGYAPIEPVQLLARACAAVRTGRPDGGAWLRRFDEGIDLPSA